MMKTICIGMKARLAGGGMCDVVDVLIDPYDGSEKYLVLSVHGYFGPDVMAPVSAAWRVDDTVWLGLTCEDATRLPRFDRDEVCRQTGLRSCAAVRHRAHWQHRAGLHYLHAD